MCSPNTSNREMPLPMSIIVIYRLFNVYRRLFLGPMLEGLSKIEVRVILQGCGLCYPAFIQSFLYIVSIVSDT